MTEPTAERFKVRVKFKIICESDAEINSTVDETVVLTYRPPFYYLLGDEKIYHPYPDGCVLDWLQYRLGTKA